MHVHIIFTLIIYGNGAYFARESRIFCVCKSFFVCVYGSSHLFCCGFLVSFGHSKNDYFFWAGWKVFRLRGHEFKIQANADFSTNVVSTITTIYAMFWRTLVRGIRLTFGDFVLWFRVEIDQLRVQFTPFLQNTDAVERILAAIEG